MISTLLLGGHIYNTQAPFATAALIHDGRFVWLGDDAAAAAYRDDAQVVDLRGALVTPAFVDAHVHATATGLALTGLDVSSARSLAEFLSQVAEFVDRSPGDVIIGHGWDDTRWPERRPPTLAEFDAAVGNAIVYLTRVDVHSALASSSLRRECDGLPDLIGYDAEGPLRRAAHDRVRTHALTSITRDQRERAQRATLRRAGALGIAAIHEMAGPVISSIDDLAALIELGRSRSEPEVIGYWGALHAHDDAQRVGAHGAAGDLSIDGAIGSRTACLHHAYADDPQTRGAQYIDVDQATEHIIGATRREMQAGFHIIGDGATDVAVTALARAEQSLGADAVRRCRHRLEHVEMIDSDQRKILARLGVIVSVQPAFDAAWGGVGGMYETRLGPDRAGSMNPFAGFASDGVVMAFGSDAPVTALDPWGSVRAAATHTSAQERITTRAAFAAHTRGGRRASRDEWRQPGVIAVDAPATYAVWEPGPLIVGAPDGRVAAWSTDPRSGTPPLPDLDAGSPACWRTVRDGEVIHDAGAWS